MLCFYLVFADNGFKIKINASFMDGENAGVFIDGRAMIPFEKVISKMGGSFSYDENLRQINVNYNNTEIVATIDDETVYVNGRAIKINHSPIIYNGNVMVPLRLISQATDAHVNWDGVQFITRIRTDNTEDKSGILLKNGGFEGTDIREGWAALANCQIELSDDARTGVYSGKVINRKSIYAQIRQDLTAAIRASGKGKYRIVAYIKTDTDSKSINDRYALRFVYHADRAEKGIYFGKSFNISGEWQEVVIECNIDWSKSIDDAYMYVENDEQPQSGIIGDYYMDDCSVIKFPIQKIFHLF